MFNDGNTKPTTTTQPCVWTRPDLDTLKRRFPQDYRPPLYRGLYLTFFYSFRFGLRLHPGVRRVPSSRARSIQHQLLPEFYIGELYSIGRLGGLMSPKSAVCLDEVVPRTTQCLALDEIHRSAVRSLTTSIALDPKFGPAYALESNRFHEIKGVSPSGTGLRQGVGTNT